VLWRVSVGHGYSAPVAESASDIKSGSIPAALCGRALSNERLSPEHSPYPIDLNHRVDVLQNRDALSFGAAMMICKPSFL